MAVELKIDGQKVDMNQKGNIAATHSIADIEEPDSTAAGYTKSVEIPLLSNMRVFRFTNELYSKEQFNNELHTAEYIVDGYTVMSGVAQIDKITYKFGSGHKLVGGSFHVSVIGAAFEWITNAKRQINELESAETVVYNMGEVYKNSIREDESLIKFFPVDRGAFWEEDYNGDKVVRKVLDMKDYHPFFNVWKTMCLIFSGYSVKSSMEDFLKRLYCSGYMPVNEDLSYIKEENDFKAGTSYDETYLHTVDVAFDLFNDIDNKEKGYFQNGVLFPGTKAYPYSSFNPKNTLTEEYEINIHYRVGIDPTSGKPTCVLANYADTFLFGTDRVGEYNNFLFEHRFTVEESIEYADKLISPAYIDDSVSFLVFSDLSPASISWSWIKFEITNKSRLDTLVLRSSSIYGVWTIFSATSIEGDVTRIYVSLLENGPWTNIADVPNAHITIVRLTRTALTFSKTLRTSAFTLTPEDCHYFICKFKSSQSTQPISGFRLFDDCSIRPDIGNYIGANKPVSISTVGGTNTQLDFLAALRQMFNLMFYTNPLAKEVFIEPRTRFYNLDRADIVDWREKIDYAKEIVVEELGADIGKAIKLAYADGNDVVQYYNWKIGTELGAYNQSLLNKTSDETKEIINDTFSPFLLRTVDSVGMTIPQETREDDQKLIDDVEIEMTPIVGYFAGVADRVAGDDKKDYPRYPQLVFQDAAKGINLGFEDIYTPLVVRGLNQYYKDNISVYNHGRRITMYLRLTPQDIEAIQLPNSQMQDFRAVYLLNFDGEDVPCLLEQIADYNPATGASTKCVFISDPHIKLTGDDLTVITYDDVAIGRNNTLTGYR